MRPIKATSCQPVCRADSLALVTPSLPPPPWWMEVMALLLRLRCVALRPAPLHMHTGALCSWSRVQLWYFLLERHQGLPLSSQDEPHTRTMLSEATHLLSSLSPCVALIHCGWSPRDLPLLVLGLVSQQPGTPSYLLVRANLRPPSSLSLGLFATCGFIVHAEHGHSPMNLHS